MTINVETWFQIFTFVQVICVVLKSKNLNLIILIKKILQITDIIRSCTIYFIDMSTDLSKETQPESVGWEDPIKRKLPVKKVSS